MEEVDRERWCKGGRRENAYYGCLLCVCYNISRRPLLVHFLNQTTFLISIK